MSVNSALVSRPTHHTDVIQLVAVEADAKPVVVESCVRTLAPSNDSMRIKRDAGVHALIGERKDVRNELAILADVWVRKGGEVVEEDRSVVTH